MQQIMQLSLTNLLSGMTIFVQMSLGLASRVGVAYLFLALADFIYQRWNHTRGLKMTKDEVKEEFKSQEGNPMLKSQIRQQGRRMARMRMMANVPKANVVITNPTHLAVAIQYDHDNMVAPKVVAKGANLVAFRIADIARANNIPVVQNIPVARAIYGSVEIDQEIPPELYAAIAEILVYVYRLKGQQPILAH
jgi:flagellar biosynthetic protein FlhB